MQYARHLTGREAQKDQLVLAGRIGIEREQGIEGGRRTRSPSGGIRFPELLAPCPTGRIGRSIGPQGEATLEFRLAQPQKQQRQGDEQRHEQQNPPPLPVGKGRERP